MSNIQVRAKFDFIRYSNCWEDPEILLQSLHPLKNQFVLSIASAGDNSFSLLTADPEKVVAVDFNPIQLACCDIRKAAFNLLSYSELLKFLGVHPSDNRMLIYNELKSQMTVASVEFWNEHPDWIIKGIIHVGKFEKYLTIFGTGLLPFIHRKETVKKLLAKKTIDEQEMFYKNKWNSFLWRGLFKIFFSTPVMGKIGRDPEFFKYSEKSPGDMILERTRHALTHLSTHNNPYLTFILTGNFNAALPHYLREENFEVIKNNLHKLELFHGGVDDALQKYPNSFTRFNLSDIFEYMSGNEFENISNRLFQLSGPLAKIAYWNLLAYRNLGNFQAQWKTDLEISNKFHLLDQAWFYSHFFISEKVL